MPSFFITSISQCRLCPDLPTNLIRLIPLPQPLRQTLIINHFFPLSSRRPTFPLHPSNAWRIGNTIISVTDTKGLSRDIWEGCVCGRGLLAVGGSYLIGDVSRACSKAWTKSKKRELDLVEANNILFPCSIAPVLLYQGPIVHRGLLELYSRCRSSSHLLYKR